MRKCIFIITSLCSLCTAVQAADNGIYIGVGVGQSTVEVDDVLATDDFDGEDLGYKVIVGIRPLDWLAFEANYVNFGEPDDTVAGMQLRSEGHGITGSALGFLSLGPVDLFAKAGLVSWDTEIGAIENDGTDLLYGAGVQFRLLSLAVRAEYEIFDIEDVDDANMISVGLTYTFL
jgi:opacity protein-like surface antigen